MPETPRYYLTLCAILRNEALYVREWLAFHAAVGVQHFYLYDNNSDDETVAEIFRFARPDMVTVIPWSKHPGQSQAYLDALKRFGPATRWMAFLDGDEFLFSPETTDLPALLKQYEHRSALGVHWLVYGSSGHVKRPPGLQIESYLHRSEHSFGPNEHIKSIVQPRFTLKPLTPHAFALKRGDLVREDDVAITGTSGATKLLPITERIRINHYFGRSKEDWDAKVARGRATKKELRPAEMFKTYDRNEVLDPAAMKIRPLMDAYLDPPAPDRRLAALVWRPLAKLRYRLMRSFGPASPRRGSKSR